MEEINDVQRGDRRRSEWPARLVIGSLLRLVGKRCRWIDGVQAPADRMRWVNGRDLVVVGSEVEVRIKVWGFDESVERFIDVAENG